jgi:dihydrolipoamide dehydrogenase
MTTIQVEVAVIGAGPGGYVCAIRLGQLGKKTLLIERGNLGGVCLNVGCIPSKALITAAKTFEKVQHADTMGILVENPRLDWGKLIGWKDGIVQKLTSGIGTLVKGNGAQVMSGEARLVAPGTLEVTTAEGPVRVEAEHLVIATGSRPIEIPGFAIDGERVIGSSEALSLNERPGRVIVIGGGYIGLEMGTMLAKLGSRVTVLERADQVLPGFDPEVAQILQRKLKKLGVEVHLGARALDWSETAAGAVVRLEKAGQVSEIACDRILVTVGRRPNVEGLGLERLGVELDAQGFIRTDLQRRTKVPGIWAIGDCAGQPMLAHKASKEAEVVAEAIAGHASAYDVRAIPAVVFTDPEVGSVGWTEAQARAEGHEVKIGKFPFAALGRAMTALETEGFIKVVADARTHEVLGLHVVGPSATDLIAEAGLALEMGACLEDLSLTVHAHPTLAEGIMEAAKAALGEAIHVLNRDPVGHGR